MDNSGNERTIAQPLAWRSESGTLKEGAIGVGGIAMMAIAAITSLSTLASNLAAVVVLLLPRTGTHVEEPVVDEHLEFGARA